MRDWQRQFLQAAGAVAVLLWLPTAAFAEEGTAGIDPGNLGHAIAAIVIFVLLLLILRKYAWGPIVSQLQMREEQIAHSLKQAERREQEARDILAEYNQQIGRARAEAEDLLATSRSQAAETSEQLLATAEEEARQLTRHARQEIDRAREDALRELRQTTADLAAEMAEEMIRKKLDPVGHGRLLDDVLSNLPPEPPRRS